MTGRVLVTGANGFVGRALCAALLQRGYAVRKAVRGADAQIASGGHGDPSHVEIIGVGDITPETDWSRALESVDIVIHLAARVHVMRDEALDPLAEFRRINTYGTQQLARSAAACGVKRMVYVSSIKVNGEETEGDKHYVEADVPAPADPYGVSKWEAELALQLVARETGLEIVVIRPPLVYGEGVRGNFVQMLRAVARGLPLPLASVRNRRDLVYLGNLVDALVVCAKHPAAAGKIYLLSDGEPVSTPELLRYLANMLGVTPRVFPFPSTILLLAARLLGKSAQARRLLGSLQVDSGKIRAELNWTPPYTLQQGLQATATWYRNTYL